MLYCKYTNLSALKSAPKSDYSLFTFRFSLNFPYLCASKPLFIMQAEVPPYQPKNKIRIVTAASLFDGHDASINIMRRIMQASGAEVIHLGHDRSAEEVVDFA